MDITDSNAYIKGHSKIPLARFILQFDASKTTTRI